LANRIIGRRVGLKQSIEKTAYG
jgi:hypothetical protein